MRRAASSSAAAAAHSSCSPRNGARGAAVDRRQRSCQRAAEAASDVVTGAAENRFRFAGGQLGGRDIEP
ncbi:hypothetical protein [Mycobacterium botniense]|uniref:hypothetical protein n=1 Tax=Mycobacterium botniense TaxID=84962 RepID=UPI0013D624B2|nr:hypothetical protein [Mycobacterium botniense]